MFFNLPLESLQTGEEETEKQIKISNGEFHNMIMGTFSFQSFDRKGQINLKTYKIFFKSTS